MKFIQKQSSYKFYLPEFPDIPEDKLKQFYSKVIMEGEPPAFNNYLYEWMGN